MSWLTKVWSTFGDMDSQESWGPDDGPTDPVGYTHFLEQFGEAAYRPDGKLKRPEDFTDPRNAELAALVWHSGRLPEQAKASEGGSFASATAPNATAEATEWNSQDAVDHITDAVLSDMEFPEDANREDAPNPHGYVLPEVWSPAPTAKFPEEETRQERVARCKRDYEKRIAAAERRRKVGRVGNAIVYGARRATEMIPTPGPSGVRQLRPPDPDIPETALELDDYWKTSRYEEDLAKAREEYERCMQGVCQLPSENARGR